MTQNENLPVLYINRSAALPDNKQWQNRFEIESESSNSLYTIAQNKASKTWGCSCPGWLYHVKDGIRHCKHLRALGLPNSKTPFEPLIANTKADYNNLISKLLKKAS